MKIFNVLNFLKATNTTELLILLSIGGLLTILMTDRFIILFYQLRAKVNAKRYSIFKARKMDKLLSLLRQESAVSTETLKNLLENDLQYLDRKSRYLFLHDIVILKRFNPEINVQNYITLIRYVQNS